MLLKPVDFVSSGNTREVFSLVDMVYYNLIINGILEH